MATTIEERKYRYLEGIPSREELRDRLFACRAEEELLRELLSMASRRDCLKSVIIRRGGEQE